MRAILLTLALTCLAALSPAHALEPDKAFRHYVSDTWSIQNGLPQISAQAVAQDATGYIWVGTQSGLARFDGVHFSTITPDTEPQLPGAWIGALEPGHDGRLWIGTYKGLAVYDGRRFKAVPADDAAKWPALDVSGIAEDPEGPIWVTTASGLFRYEHGLLHAIPGSPVPARAPMVRPDGLWVGGRGVVERLLRTGRWEVLPLPRGFEEVQVNRLVTAQGAVWAATSKGLFRLAAGGWIPFADAPQFARVPVQVLYQDRDGNLWAGGDVGLARIRRGRLAEFVPAAGAGGITGLRTAFEDREGNLWLGSQWSGITRLWSSWTRRYSVAEGLGDRIVWSVDADPDGHRLWVGGNDGVSVLQDSHFRQVVRGDALPHPQGYNILAERGRLWIGTRGGLRVLDEGQSQPHALPELAAIGGVQINGLVRAPDGVLWIGTTEGLFAFDRGQLRRYAQPEGLADPRIRTLYVDGGELLVGSQSGLYERHGERFTRAMDAGLPAAPDVTAILRLSDGHLAIGTFSERVYVSDGRRWHVLDPDDGMPANAPFYLAEHEGVFWVAGIRGISRVPVADVAALLRGTARKVHGEMLLNERGDRMSGQQGYCCNGAGSSKGELIGSTLWLPTRDGVVAMDTGTIRKNPYAPGVVVERVESGSKWTPAWQMAGHELAGDSRDITIDFTALSFQDPKSVQLQYRLTGYDRNWIDADSVTRSARYTNLPPGHYRFEVLGGNNAGVWNRKPAVFAFSVHPRFHETAWFAALVVGLLALLIFVGYRWQRHRFRVRQDALELIVQQRTDALAQANRQLEEASHTDPLTGLRNRRYIGSQLPADLSFYDRQIAARVDNDRAMLFALVDIDHFKHVNDRYGHRAGDLVLQQFAAVLEKLVRTGDYVARWGGEEFLLVFRPMPQRNVSTIGARIQSAVVEHAFDLGNGLVLPLTCSVGLSQYPIVREDGAQLSWESMIELADQALYYVKGNGRNGWASFRPTALTRMDHMLADMHAGLDKMLDSGQLSVMGEIAGLSVGTPAPAPMRPTPRT